MNLEDLKMRLWRGQPLDEGEINEIVRVYEALKLIAKGRIVNHGDHTEVVDVDDPMGIALTALGEDT